MIKKLYKYTSILVIVMFSLSIISCKTSVTPVSESLIETNTVKLNKENVVETESQSIEVDKGILSVEITLPASFFEGEDISSIADVNKDNDIKVTKNSDGSVTYKMSKSKHNELMQEIKNSLIDYIEEVKNNEDYKSIEDITYNKTFSELTMVVDQEAFEGSLDGFVAFGLGMMSLYYQLFNGVNPENYKVTIHLKNVGTGGIFRDIVYPDAFEN